MDEAQTTRTRKPAETQSDFRWPNIEKPGPRAKPSFRKGNTNLNNGLSKSPIRSGASKLGNKKTSIVPPVQEEFAFAGPAIESS